MASEKEGHDGKAPRMEDDVINHYKKASSISESVTIFSKPMLKEGASILEVADNIEERIKYMGGGIAFPVNVSINENAAHYTPDIGDQIILRRGDLVKIDIGVQVEGYIWDSAFTVCVGNPSHPIIEAAEKALAESIKLIAPGTRIMDISEVVESEVTKAGFNPIRNLCGHGLGQYVQHARLSIPNGRNNIRETLEPGQAIAMEVFATDGGGWVKESGPALIFGYVQDKPVRMPEARKVLEASRKDYNSLPFAKRWLTSMKIPHIKIDMALDQLLSVDAIRQYPILKEQSNGMVAQAETTVLI
jgi:methionyl aminopeptidase